MPTSRLWSQKIPSRANRGQGREVEAFEAIKPLEAPPVMVDIYLKILRNPVGCIDDLRVIDSLTSFATFICHSRPIADTPPLFLGAVLHICRDLIDATQTFF